VLIDEHGAVLAALYDQRGRTHLENVASGAEQVVFAGKLTGFGIVDHEDVDMLEGFAEFGIGALDPVVHGVHGGEFGSALDLLEDVALEIGSNVGEENVSGIAIFFRKARLEFSEHVEIGGKGDAIIQVFGIAAGPEEAFARGALEAFDVDGALAKKGFVIRMKIISNDGDEIYMSKESRANGEVRGGTAEGAFDFSIWTFESVIRN